MQSGRKVRQKLAPVKIVPDTLHSKNSGGIMELKLREGLEEAGVMDSTCVRSYSLYPPPKKTSINILRIYILITWTEVKTVDLYNKLKNISKFIISQGRLSGL